jgi:Tol biopolymer transport system component
MTARHDVDRQLTAWLEAERPTTAPDGLLEAIQREIASTPRRRSWLIADRWIWHYGAGLRTVARGLALAAVLAALILLLPVIFGLIGSARPAPPFGLARPGLIAVDTADGIVVARADGSDRAVLVASSGGQAVSPTWSRDGLHLAYWERPDSEGPWSLVVVDPDGMGREVLAEHVTLRDREEGLAQPSNISWSPDSERTAFAADVEGGGTAIFVARLGQSSPTRITDPELLGIDPAWSPSGDAIAFQSEATGTLRVIGPDGTNERRLSSLSGTFLWPDWSPDGSRLATAAFTEGQADIFIVTTDGTGVSNVSRNAAQEYSPSWSPDGSRLAWARVPIGGSDRGWVVVTNPNGPNLTEIRIDADLAPPVWAPDGTRIYSYVQATDGTFKELVVLDPSGVAPIVRLPAEGNLGNGNWQRLP